MEVDVLNTTRNELAPIGNGIVAGIVAGILTGIATRTL